VLWGDRHRSGQREATGRLVNRKGLFPEHPGFCPNGFGVLHLFTTVPCMELMDGNGLPQESNALRKIVLDVARHLDRALAFCKATSQTPSEAGTRAARFAARIIAV
jgi:hypothetical protein